MKVLITIILFAHVIWAIKCPSSSFGTQQTTLIEHEYDRTKFYKCLPDGTVEEMKCATGFEFNSMLSTCDTPKTLRENERISQIAYIKWREIVCLRKSDGTLIPNYENACRTYFECINGQANERQCAIGTFFDIDILMCNYAVTCDCTIDICPNDDLENIFEEIDKHQTDFIEDTTTVISVTPTGPPTPSVTESTMSPSPPPTPLPTEVPLTETNPPPPPTPSTTEIPTEPSSTETPSPPPTPEPTETASPPPTPVPTETPSPPPTPEPTETPSPPPTPEPTETPSPPPTPTSTETHPPPPTPSSTTNDYCPIVTCPQEPECTTVSPPECPTCPPIDECPITCPPIETCPPVEECPETTTVEIPTTPTTPAPITTPTTPSPITTPTTPQPPFPPIICVDGIREL